MSSSVDLVNQMLLTALGPGQVSWSEVDLVRYAHDSSPLEVKRSLLGDHAHKPDVVVRACSTEDVLTVIDIARMHSVPLTARGLGSSVTGQPLSLAGGIVLDLAGLRGEPDINEVDRTVTVGAGWNGGELEDALRVRGYTLGNSPQSLLRSTVGGWVATGATGQLSSYYGGIENLLVTLHVVLADSTVVELGAIPRASMGPDLKSIFIGSEGTLGIVTQVTLRIDVIPEFHIREAFHVPTLDSGVRSIRSIAHSGLRPELVRLYDCDEAAHVLEVPEFDGSLLFLATHGKESEARFSHDRQKAIAVSHGAVSLGAQPVEIWEGKRFDFSAVERVLQAPGGYAETIEVAHSWSKIMPLYRDLKHALGQVSDQALAHFSHIYPQGTSLYLILLGSAEDDAAAVDRLQRIWETAMRVALDHGAVLSHHHGAGITRMPYMAAALGNGLGLLQSVKNALDPNNILNPGKLALTDNAPTGHTERI